MQNKKVMLHEEKEHIPVDVRIQLDSIIIHFNENLVGYEHDIADLLWE